MTIPAPPGGSTGTAVQTSTSTGPLSNIKPTSGVWVGVALVGGIAVSGTKAAPLAFGLLSVALIYQLQQLLSGK